VEHVPVHARNRQYSLAQLIDPTLDYVDADDPEPRLCRGACKSQADIALTDDSNGGMS
jgi:hypothetical protein